MTSDTNEERDYLRGELVELRRAFRLGAVTFGCMVVLVAGYFQWMRVQLSEVLEPKNLAEMAVSEARRNLPAARDSLKENIRVAAPEVVEFVTAEVMDEALPMVRESAEALFRDYARELAGFGREAVVKIFHDLIRDHKADLMRPDKHPSAAMEAVLAQRASQRKMGEATPAAYVEVTGSEIDTQAIAKRLSRYVGAELGQRLSDTPEETLRQKLDESVKALRRINAHLKQMAEAKPG